MPIEDNVNRESFGGLCGFEARKSVEVACGGEEKERASGLTIRVKCSVP